MHIVREMSLVTPNTFAKTMSQKRTLSHHCTDGHPGWL